MKMDRRSWQIGLFSSDSPAVWMIRPGCYLGRSSLQEQWQYAKFKPMESCLHLP